MNGFTDIHTHILPGADDGASDIGEAMRLLSMAYKNGTRTMVLTPHYRGKFKHSPLWLQEHFSILQKLAEEKFPGMKLYLGNEVHYELDAPDKLIAKEILTMNRSRYALLEFRAKSMRSQVINGVAELLQCGFVPIIAHVERYEVFREDASLVDEVLEMGALLQMNANSVMEDDFFFWEDGFKMRQFCHSLLREEKVHFIASDAHDAEKRPPLLRECFLRIHKKYGSEYAARLFYENAQAVIENRRIH